MILLAIHELFSLRGEFANCILALVTQLYMEHKTNWLKINKKNSWKILKFLKKNKKNPQQQQSTKKSSWGIKAAATTTANSSFSSDTNFRHKVVRTGVPGAISLVRDWRDLPGCSCPAVFGSEWWGRACRWCRPAEGARWAARKWWWGATWFLWKWWACRLWLWFSHPAVQLSGSWQRKVASTDTLWLWQVSELEYSI